MELRNRRWRQNEDLPSLYSDVHRLMSLAYPGPDKSSMKEMVGRDAFLDVLGDPELRVHILEKGATTIDDALRTAMSLEVLDKSKENHKKSWTSFDDPFEDDPHKKKRMSRWAVKSVEAAKGSAVNPESSEVTVTQLQEALASCMKEMAEMWKTFGAIKGPPTQQNTTVQKVNRPSYNQAAGGPLNNSSFRPHVPNGQAAGGYRGAGPRQNYVPRGSVQCFKCRQWGHIAPCCPNNPGI